MLKFIAATALAAKPCSCRYTLGCTPLAPPRPEWEEEATLTANYAANRFVLDPNEGFGRNARPLPLKSKEEREVEDGGTYSDDDGARRGGGQCAHVGAAVCLATQQCV